MEWSRREKFLMKLKSHQKLQRDVIQRWLSMRNFQHKYESNELELSMIEEHSNNSNLERNCREHFSDIIFLMETKNSIDHVLRVQA